MNRVSINMPRQLQAKINPFSRYAGDLPVLAPAGRSTKIDQVYRRSITVDQGKRALVVLTNVGQGQNHGLVYQWKSDDPNSFDVSQISFNMLPTDSGSCTEMRASKSTLIIKTTQHLCIVLSMPTLSWERTDQR